MSVIGPTTLPTFPLLDLPLSTRMLPVRKNSPAKDESLSLKKYTNTGDSNHSGAKVLKLDQGFDFNLESILNDGSLSLLSEPFLTSDSSTQRQNKQEMANKKDTERSFSSLVFEDKGLVPRSTRCRHTCPINLQKALGHIKLTGFDLSKGLDLSLNDRSIPNIKPSWRDLPSLANLPNSPGCRIQKVKTEPKLKSEEKPRRKRTSIGSTNGMVLLVQTGTCQNNKKRASKKRSKPKKSVSDEVKEEDPVGEPLSMSCPGELDGVAMKGWPLLFHHNHSDNIQLSLDKRRAKRFESFCKGICFSSRPIALNERVYLRFSEVSTSWSGVVRFGLMSHDPATINGSELPRYACPDLTNKPGYWAKAVPERFAEQSNTLFFYYTRTGDVMFGLNNEDKGLFFSGVNTNGPLWGLVDIYGNSTSMEFIDGRQMNNLSPSSGVAPPIDGSVSPELMQAYASMRLQQPSPGLSPGGHSQSMPSLPAAPGFSATGPPVRFYNTVSFNPLPFHAKCGRNVCFSSDKTIALRLVEEYCNGYVFTQRPLRPGERLVIQILSVDTAFVGGLAFGMTACDPKHLNTDELPDDSDLLLDRPEYWVVNKDVCSAPEVGDELSFHLTEEGEVRYGKNGHHVATLMHVDKTLPLWVFFDVYGSTQKIKSLGIVSGLLPVSAQHRASISSGGGLTVALPPPRQTNSPSSSSSTHVPTSSSSNITPPPRPPPPRNSPSTRQPPPPRSESPTPPSLPPKPFRPLPAPPPAPGTILQPTPALSAVPPASQLSPPPVAPRTHSSQTSSTTTLATAPSTHHHQHQQHQHQHQQPSSANNMARVSEMMMRVEHESQEAADNASNECSVCFEKAVDCVLYTCGHMCLCYECAVDIKDNQGALCPICRQAIKDIIKIYRS